MALMNGRHQLVLTKRVSDEQEQLPQSSRQEIIVFWLWLDKQHSVDGRSTVEFSHRLKGITLLDREGVFVASCGQNRSDPAARLERCVRRSISRLLLVTCCSAEAYNQRCGI
jgi:hypothetical protein